MHRQWVNRNLSKAALCEPQASHVAKWTDDVIRVNCADKAFDFIRSGDFTIEELQDEVARLMRCNPREIIVVASDVDMKSETKSMAPDCSATFLSYATRIHFKIVRAADADDVEMEDVQGP